MENSLGQLMIIGFEGTKATDELLSFIRGEKIGGVILFKRNFGSKKQLKRLIDDLQDAAGGNLIVSIDHEGGRVMRLSKPFTHFPAAAEVAKIYFKTPSPLACPERSRRVGEGGGEGETSYASHPPLHPLPSREGKFSFETSSKMGTAYDVGLKMANELSSVGINLNFAPVLDVATNTFNTVIGDRSFSGDPAVVADLGIRMMRGLIDGGVLACGKHFPGHGDTDSDSHLSLPVIPHTRRRLDACELRPFRAAIAAKIPMMMTAHLLVPNLDPKWPASISKQITTNLLRKELGFEGVIITDDLRMKGIANFVSIPDAAVRALEAGHDMVMICRDLDLQIDVLDGLKRAADDGRVADIEGRLALITALKSRI